MTQPQAILARSSAARHWLVVLLMSAALLASAQKPPAAGAQPLYTGVTNIGTRAPLGFERTRATGAQFIRIPLYWGGTAPERLPQGDNPSVPHYAEDPGVPHYANWTPEDPGDPRYEWGESDDDVTRAVAAGLTPVLQIDGAPEWAQRCKTPPVVVPAICNPDPAALRAFATAAARRYSGATPGIPAVRYWQALNEPNLSLFFFPQYDTAGNALSPELYRHLVNAFYAGIKTVSQDNVVLAAGLGPIAVPPWTIGPMQFARELLCMRGSRRPKPAPGDCGGGVHFDVFAIQPYTTGAPTRKGKANDVQLGDLGKLQRLLSAADRAGRIKSSFPRTPLWITEFSWDTKPPDPGGLPMRIEKRWTAEALYRAWRAGVDHFFWFSLRDDVHDPDRKYSETLQSGLYFRGPTVEQDRPKPILQAFRFPFVAYPKQGKLKFWGRTPTSGPGEVRIQLLRGGRWRDALVVEADSQGIFRGRIPTKYGHNQQGSARARFANSSTVPFSMRPVEDFRHPPFGAKTG